jgi:hypothetical protein
MELICRILKQHPLQTRQYTDRNGQPQSFTAMGFNLASGTDTFFAELTGEQATKCGQCDEKCFYKVDLSARAEAWTDQQGNVRNGTRLYINRIAVL